VGSMFNKSRVWLL